MAKPVQENTFIVLWYSSQKLIVTPRVFLPGETVTWDALVTPRRRVRKVPPEAQPFFNEALAKNREALRLLIAAAAEDY